MGSKMAKAAAVLDEARNSGVKLFIEGGRIACQPRPNESLKEKILDNREAVFELLLSNEKPREGVDYLESLRVFAPNLWRLVRIEGGQIGLLWGVTANGVNVSLGPKAGILTLNPKDVTLLNIDESE